MVEEFAEPTTIETGLGPIVAEPARPEDEVLAERVAEALWDYYPIRATTDELRVYVDRGIVELSGVVRTDAQKLIAADLAAHVAGVSELRNQLVSDDELIRAVGLALACDERTVKYLILVRSMLGEVRLRGRSADAGIADVAATIARQVPGVGHVVIDFSGE